MLSANRCAATADGMDWGRWISQIGHSCRSAALAPSPLCPRSLLRETDCVQTRGANRILMRRSKKHLYSITSSAKQDSWDRLLRDLGVDHALPRAIVIEFTIRYATQQQSVGLRNCGRACNEPHSVVGVGFEVPSSHAGCCEVAQRCTRLRSPDACGRGTLYVPLSDQGVLLHLAGSLKRSHVQFRNIKSYDVEIGTLDEAGLAGELSRATGR